MQMSSRKLKQRQEEQGHSNVFIANRESSLAFYRKIFIEYASRLLKNLKSTKILSSHTQRMTKKNKCAYALLQASGTFKISFLNLVLILSTALPSGISQQADVFHLKICQIYVAKFNLIVFAILDIL